MERDTWGSAPRESEDGSVELLPYFGVDSHDIGIQSKEIRAAIAREIVSEKWMTQLSSHVCFQLIPFTGDTRWFGYSQPRS
jgi:hypothetical protein